MSRTGDLGALIKRSTAHYQPIVDLDTRQVLGAEALVRFVDPDGTVRGPSGVTGAAAYDRLMDAFTAAQT